MFGLSSIRERSPSSSARPGPAVGGVGVVCNTLWAKRLAVIIDPWASTSPVLGSAEGIGW